MTSNSLPSLAVKLNRADRSWAITPRRLRTVAAFATYVLCIWLVLTAPPAAPPPDASSRVGNVILAPIVLPVEVCNGLTNQRISLVQGITQAIIIGAQIVMPSYLPSNGTEIPGVVSSNNLVAFDSIFDGKAFDEAVRVIYSKYWCARPHLPQSKLWCGHHRNVHDPVLRSRTVSEVVDLVRLSKPLMSWRKLHGLKSPELSSAIGPRLFREFSRSAMGWGVLDRGCTMFSLRVLEGGSAWDLFWAVDSSLKFSNSVIRTARILESKIREQSKGNSKRWVGDSFVTETSSNHRFTVLHLRVERDWELHCREWMSIRDGVHRDNCLNNSRMIHNTLISEGVPRYSNIYICSGLLSNELRMQNLGLRELFRQFNILTKDTILGRPLPHDFSFREWWAAVETELAMSSDLFVGNSVSTFSAYTMQARRKVRKPGWHYNGGGIPLSDAGILAFRESLSVKTFPKRLKWVFTINQGPSEMSKSFEKMLKIAVLSAKRETNLIPVCVTTSSPQSKLSQWLISENVRVIHHHPTWASKVEATARRYSKIPRRSGTEKSHLSKDPAAMVGTFLRIDIPILGFIDEFVLYTDVDVMFTGPVTWRSILPESSLYTATLQNNDMSRGKMRFGKVNAPGLPTYFSTSCEMKRKKDTNFMNAGVMVLNMRNMRATHERFLQFILRNFENNQELNWPSGPGDQGALREFYKTSLNGHSQVEASLLPYEMNWKSYWERSANASIIHFHGPKCELDIIPYFSNRVITVPKFKTLLETCASGGDCYRLCMQAQKYLA